MRFLITAGVDPNKPQPEGEPPMDEAMIAAYMKFNEDMHKAGVLVTTEGLLPGGVRARVVVGANGKRTLTDGPFTETKELLGGLYVIQVNSKEEAIEWALRCPTGLGTDEVLEIYQMTDAADIPPEIMDIVKKAAPTWSETFVKQK